MEALTKEQVSLLLAGTRNRGGHERNIRKFIESGELYVTVSDFPEYKEKDRNGSEEHAYSGRKEGRAWYGAVR
jgi:hypothetical protein